MRVLAQLMRPEPCMIGHAPLLAALIALRPRGAGRRLPAPGRARHRTRARGRSPRPPRGSGAELPADAAAGRQGGGADLRRRPVAGDDAAGAGGAGARMRARDLLPDRHEQPPSIPSWCAGWRPRDTPSATTPGRTAISKHIKPAEAVERDRSRHRRRSKRRCTARPPRRRARRSSAFPISTRRRHCSICCRRAASWCSAPICGPATGIR